METAKMHGGLKSAGIVLWNLTLISVGSALCAEAINGILIPKHFVSGGLTGLAIVIHYLLPALQVGWIYFLLNIPLYALGWVYVGRRFFYYSIAGLFIFSGAISVIHFPIAVQDKILSALLAGIISGAGSGVILRSFGSAGGTDILSIILYKKFSIRPGSTVLVFSTTVLFSAAVL
ncbi:YitT family protein, partial [Desulfobacteraceae bacterium SEEP-SAG9]